jgi:Zn-dependent M28 family amino/carboxypeptidase
MRTTRLRRPLWAAGAVVTTAALAATAAVAPASAAPNNNTSDKLRSAVTVEAVMAHQRAFQAIADRVGGNRFAGLPGHGQSADYVESQLRAAGFSPTRHDFTYPAFFERTPSRLSAAALSTQPVNGVDFRVMSYSGSGNVSGPLAAPSGDQRGCYAADYSGFPAGAVAVVSRGTPAGFPGGACTFRIKADNARAAGAVAVVVYNNVPGVVNGTLGATGLSGIPALGATPELGQRLLAARGSSATVVTDTAEEVLQTSNVLAELPGKDPSKVIMVGAHLDSVTAGPGINDNGSGSAAILETAVQLAKTRPTYTVRFAWWSAEESGLVGASRYVTSLSEAERKRIAAYLNFDMIGSPNAGRFVYDGDNSAKLDGGAVGPVGSAAIEALFVDYFSQQGLATGPTPFNGRSDYGPFIAVGIPAGGLFTGAEGVKTAEGAQLYGGTAGVAYDACYHAACDNDLNVDPVVLDQMSDAVAHSVLSLAMSTSAIDGAKGKGNFRTVRSGSADAPGTDSGGGLHDHDDHDLES